MIDSPTLSFTNISWSDGNLPSLDAVNGLKKRERHFSGGVLGLDPFPDEFTNTQLDDYFNYFVNKNIRYDVNILLELLPTIFSYVIV